MNRTARVLAAIAGVCLLSSSASATPAVAAGTYHVLLLLDDGTVRAWGNNVGGQLGDGTRVGKATPVTVYETPPPNTNPTTPISNVVAIAAGFGLTLVFYELPEQRIGLVSG